MLFKFVILSDEVDGFLREITIDSEATFFDFHTALLDSVGFTKDQMTSFFVCSDSWEKEQEITLFEMDAGSEYDNLVMSETNLNEFVSDEGQKLLYVFDYLSERALFIELKEIIPGKNLKSAVCSISKGTPPEQQLSFESIEGATTSPNLGLDEPFYGDEGYELDELDEEGYSDLNMGGDDIKDTEDSNL